jgi:hypothetical protein
MYFVVQSTMALRTRPSTPSWSSMPTRYAWCTGPHGLDRVFDATANDVVTYGSAEHAGVLDEVGVLLATVAAEQPFWPGDSLLPALGRLTGGR